MSEEYPHTSPFDLLMAQIEVMGMRADRFRIEAEASQDVEEADKHMRVYMVLTELLRLGHHFNQRNTPGQAPKQLPALDDSLKNAVVTDYWLTYYASDHCTLCGNTGVIDTRGVCTPAGVPVGRCNWCICPNGQAMRGARLSLENR